MSGERTTIRGVVIPVEWDVRGKVLAVAISARDESEYRVEKYGEGVNLMRLIHREVKVTGEVTEESGKKTIRVEAYRLQKVPDQQSIH
jgi:hypothetical protein